MEGSSIQSGSFYSKEQTDEITSHEYDLEEVDIKSPKRSSILQKVRKSKKQHPEYKNMLKELERKNYEEAVRRCLKLLNMFPKSYSLRCILAYTYRYLNKYDEALSYLGEALDLKVKNPAAWYIRGEISFRKKDYRGTIDNLNNLSISKDFKDKTNNLYVILGLSYLLQEDYSYALYNFNAALQNNPNNYLCLKSCAYIHEIKKRYSDALRHLDIILSINKNDSLILCYYGEILINSERYDEAILCFAKANRIDPVNIHVLYKSAIANLSLKKYNEALLDAIQAMQLDHSNISLIYIRCQVYIGLQKFHEALLDFDILAFKLNHKDINSLLERHPEFWSYLCNQYNINNNDSSDFKDFDNFNKYMYKVKMVYRMSNLEKISRNYNLQEDKHSLTGKVAHINNNNTMIELPKLQNVWESSDYHIIWKIRIMSKSYGSSIKFTIKTWMTDLNINYERYEQHEHRLENLSKLPEGEWSEYTLPFAINTRELQWIQLFIEVNGGGIDMYVDYVRFSINSTFLEMGQPLSMDGVMLNVPEAFKDVYFSKREMENLLKFKDIIDYL